MNKKYILEESIGFVVRNFTKALRDKILDNFKSSGYNINIEVWITLAYLNRFEDKNQQELGTLLLQDKTAVTRLVSSMEDDGLIKRVIDEKDKRNKLLHLTKNGKDLYSKLVVEVEKTLNLAFVGIDNEEVEKTKQTLLKMQNNLNDAQGI